MISLQSKTTHESKSVPGVTFTVRALNKIQRAKRDLPVAEARQRLAMLISEYAPLAKIDEADRTEAQSMRMREIDFEFSLIDHRDIMPAEIRAGLVSIEGLEIDGKPATVESLIEGAGADMDDLIEEIAVACKAASGLSAAETKNSESATTSSGQADPS